MAILLTPMGIETSMHTFWANHKTWLLAALLSLGLVFAQGIESQHDHDQFAQDCYLCQQSTPLACEDNPQPGYDEPKRGSWHETSPYHRHLRTLDKRGQRDPPVSTAVPA